MNTPDSVILDTFLGYLHERPSINRVAQYLTLVSLAEFDVWSVAFLHSSERGAIALGSFGLEESSLLRLEKLPVFSPGGVASALASNSPVSNVNAEGDHVCQYFPDLAHDCGPLVMLPITLPDDLYGAIVFSLLHHHYKSALIARLHCLRSALGLSVLLAQSSALPEPSSHSVLNLSMRQMQILALMGLGETNSSIALTIGFSPSTVRHETMRIFRFLGVNERESAVHEAIRRGLIPEGNTQFDRSH